MLLLRAHCKSTNKHKGGYAKQTKKTKHGKEATQKGMLGLSYTLQHKSLMHGAQHIYTILHYDENSQS